MTTPFAILGAGMITGVGASAPASCAAIRCGMNNFNETRFIDGSGNWIVGSEVKLDQPWRGLTKLSKMAASAIRECLGVMPERPKADASIPLVLCIAEEERPGRLPGLGGPLLLDIERELGLKFHPDSSVVAQGRVGGAIACLRAQKLIQERANRDVIVCGVDTYLTGPTLVEFDDQGRLLTRANSNGFVPGEAAAAVLCGRAGTSGGTALACRGLGFGREAATINSDQPLRGEGMVQATRLALAEAGIDLGGVDWRISDVSGEHYRFKEVALATTRLRRDRRSEFGIWHPADCIGETGAASVPAMLGVLYYGARKAYLPGPTFLAHISNDDDKRAALIVSAEGPA